MLVKLYQKLCRYYLKIVFNLIIAYRFYQKQYVILSKKPSKTPYVLGIILMRNEALILQDTLDHLSKIADKIIVFDDCSNDGSRKIAEQHHAVIAIIQNKKWMSNRIYEESINRQTLLQHALKYNPSWIFCCDCDERFEGNIRNFLLSKEAWDIDGVRINLLDAYLTDTDKIAYTSGPLFNFRHFYGPEKREILMIWKNKKNHAWFLGSICREPFIDGKNIISKFWCQHYGKALSIQHWEDTCTFYSENFPEPYKTKWLLRKGNAIHTKSDFGRALYNWEDAKLNSITVN